MMSNQPQRTLKSPETGKKIKHYLYQYADIIGTGNFAKVYKGVNMQNNSTVAIKMISLDELKSRHLEELVFEEIRILQQLKHPNILSFHQALLSERNCYIVTDYCRSGNLEERIKTRVPLSPKQLSNIILDIWNGLRYLKQKGVTHRDLKPANIFLDNGTAIIADFGLAKFYRQRFRDLDIGSPQYMSPQGVVLNCYSDKTDIWALGIIIYQLTHAETPFNFCKNQQELRYHLTRPIPEQRWRKDINPSLRQLASRCLEIDEARRPSINELANQPYLRQLLQRGNMEKMSIGHWDVPHKQIKNTAQQIAQTNVQPDRSFKTSPNKEKMPTHTHNDSSDNSSKKFNFRKELPVNNHQKVNQNKQNLSCYLKGNQYGAVNQAGNNAFRSSLNLKGGNMNPNSENSDAKSRRQILPYNVGRRLSVNQGGRQLSFHTADTTEDEEDRRMSLQNGKLY